MDVLKHCMIYVLQSILHGKDIVMRQYFNITHLYKNFRLCFMSLHMFCRHSTYHRTVLISVTIKSQTRYGLYYPVVRTLILDQGSSLVHTRITVQEISRYIRQNLQKIIHFGSGYSLTIWRMYFTKDQNCMVFTNYGPED